MALVACPLSFCHAQGTGSSNTIARFEVLRTNQVFLTIDVELFDREKPETVRNFLAYVRSGEYQNLVLHRLERNFVIQAGGVRQKNPLSPQAFFSYIPVTTYGSIPNEFSVGQRLSNVLGTLAMARVPGQTNSATSQWFFNLADNPLNDEFDGGYTVFGRVVNTVNDRTGTNALVYFNSISSNSIRTVLTFSPFAIFDSVPVIHEEESGPALRDLFYFRISILNERPRDRIRPKLAITTPTSKSMDTTDQLVQIAGTASDDRDLLRVIAAEAGRDWVPAEGTSNWQFMVRLDPGTNVLTVASLDAWGNLSAPIRRTIFYQVPAPISLEILGSGSVLGASDGQMLDIGRHYALVAKPNPGHYFAGWRNGTGTNTGPRFSSSPKLSAQMAENLALTAEFVPILAPISITTNGSGTIAGVTGGQLLTLGRTYVATAKPGPGQFFIGWRGGFGTNQPALLSIYPRLAFNMLPDLFLIADFYPNIFPDRKGTYNGVFSPANGAAPRNSGWLTLNLAANRNYSGRLQPLGSSFLIRGAFDVFGRSSISGRLGTNTLILNLQLHTNGTERITGNYFDGTTYSDLLMYRAPKFSSAPPQAGQYTFVIPGLSTNSSGSMEGHGVGTVTIDAAGKLVMSGTLADGTEISQTTALLADGHWPLLGKAYRDGGLIGMMTFFTNGVAGFDGDVKWINPTLAVPLKESTRVIGSGYTPPSMEHPLFDWTAGVAEISGGDLPGTVEEDVTAQTNGIFEVVPGVENLQLTLTPGTGIIAGSFVHPATSSVTPIKAAVLQNSNSASGFFISGGQSGGIHIRAK